MKPNLENHSVVFLSQQIKPTDFKPDALQRTEVLREKDGWMLSDPLVFLPHFTRITLENGVVIDVTHGKLMINAPVVKNLLESPAVTIAHRFLEIHKELLITAVGINFSSIFFNTEPEQIIKRIMQLRNSPLMEEGRLETTAVLYSRKDDHSKLNFKVEVSYLKEINKETGVESEAKLAINVSSNFHYDCTPEGLFEKSIDCLSNLVDNWKEHSRLIKLMRI